MGIKKGIALLMADWRRQKVDKIIQNPEKAQRYLLKKLIHHASQTQFGITHRFNDIKTYSEYRQAVPIRSYEAFEPYIKSILSGENNVLWKGKPLYLAKTSGTTSGTKYIPISKASMPYHIKGAKDALLFYINRTKNASFLEGKMLFLSGSPVLENHTSGIKTGRLSGIANHYVPNYLQRNRLPTWDVNCIEDWEEKVTKIAEQAISTDLRLVSGIPPWVRMFFDRTRELTGKIPADIWPNLQIYVHGGVDFSPYKTLFEESLGRKTDIVEVYPASEGFIAVQDKTEDEGLLLMLDYGIFFEFIPLSEYGKPNAKRIPLWQVELGVQYAIILTTNAGLWAYDIGDTVKFTSLSPYRIKVSGRVKHFISAFGEHVIGEEVNAAMNAACLKTGAKVNEFTVAPYIGERSYHEWWVEFLEEPCDFQAFMKVIDDTLSQKNSYYADLLTGNILQPAVLRKLKPNACNEFMKSIGKLGGQNKFPRLANDRNLVNALSIFEIK